MALHKHGPMVMCAKHLWIIGIISTLSRGCLKSPKTEISGKYINPRFHERKSLADSGLCTAGRRRGTESEGRFHGWQLCQWWQLELMGLKKETQRIGTWSNERKSGTKQMRKRKSFLENHTPHSSGVIADDLRDNLWHSRRLLRHSVHSVVGPGHWIMLDQHGFLWNHVKINK